MNDFLEWFRLEEMFQILALATLLIFIGEQLVRPDSETYRRARYFTSAVFLLYTGMGAYTFGPSSITELLIINIRALLACGLAYGLALVSFGPAAFIIRRVKAVTLNKTKPAVVEPPTPTLQPVPMPRDFAAEEREEKQRMDTINDAKALASEFYDEHADALRESLPVALFKTHMHTKFPDNIAAELAWQAAQQMIADMIPLIAKRREQDRAVQEELRSHEKQARDEAMKLDEAVKKTLTMERLIAWRTAEEERLKANLPPGPELKVHLINLAERFSDLMRTAIDEAQP